MIRRLEEAVCEAVKTGGPAKRVLGVIGLIGLTIVALVIGGGGAYAGMVALFLLADMMGTRSPTLPALVLVLFMYPFWRGWQWWSRRKPIEKPTFFEIEYTDNAGCILRALTPEARAWAEKFLDESRLPNGDYLVSRAIVGGVIAGASKRGYLVRMV
jgi:hypothetical protein